MADMRKVRFAPEAEDMASSPPKYTPRPKLQIPSEANQMKIKRGSLNPLEDLVQCSLCMDKLTDARMLSCQHTFCLSCLQSYLPLETTNLNCPTCGQNTPLENGLETLEQLPGNMYIDSILKMLSGGSPPKTPTKFGPETHCVKCLSLCQFSEHSCQHCKQIFCGVCWPSHLSELRNQLSSLRLHLQESLGRLEHRVESYRDRSAQLEASVRAAAEHRIAEVRDKERACLLEAAEVRQRDVDSAAALRDRLQNMQQEIDEKVFDTENDDKQKVARYMSLHRSTATLLDELSRWGDSRTFFDADAFKLDYESEASPDAEADDDVLGGGGPVAENPLDNPDSLVLHYKTRSFAPKLTWTKCLRPAGVAVAPWATNCMYIAGTDSRQIYGVDKQKNKLLFRISTPAMLCPVGIAISQTREEIFVTDKWKHCIHVFSKEGVYLKSLGKKGSSHGHFRSPEGIAVTSNNRLFVCDTGNDRIQVLDAADGKFLYDFGITGSGKAVTAAGFLLDFNYTELNIPTGIAVTEKRVVIADSGNRRIKIYTLEGLKVSEFGSLGKNKGQFRTPEVVAVDPMGFILVGDSGNARVQIFRPNGTLVRVFGTKGKLAWVSGIHVTPQLEIIVTDYKNHTVNVF